MDSPAREWLDSYTEALLPGLLRACQKEVASGRRLGESPVERRRRRPSPSPTWHAQVPTPEKKSSTPGQTPATARAESPERPQRPTERAAARRAEREREAAAKKHRW